LTNALSRWGWEFQHDSLILIKVLIKVLIKEDVQHDSLILIKPLWLRPSHHGCLQGCSYPTPRGTLVPLAPLPPPHHHEECTQLAPASATTLHNAEGAFSGEWVDKVDGWVAECMAE
jgi:hypothetical protein